ncbi:hypothetical protein [Ruminiclostridium cellobioparum]|uniref:hypothetical protein n=1 Tax=Ruminiclostridium cellobioparum TaxID=29355 RepID=UPI000485EC26|nr:hypothetical protein [Ruminiclostridium cellobioparum]
MNNNNNKLNVEKFRLITRFFNLTNRQLFQNARMIKRMIITYCYFFEIMDGPMKKASNPNFENHRDGVETLILRTIWEKFEFSYLLLNINK